LSIVPATARSGARSKNTLQPHRRQHWVIPPKANSAFVAAMEDVLAVYTRPRDGDVKPVGFLFLLRLLLLLAVLVILLSSFGGRSSVIRLERDADRDTGPGANGAVITANRAAVILVWRVHFLAYFTVTLANRLTRDTGPTTSSGAGVSATPDGEIRKRAALSLKRRLTYRSQISVC
jgi:hypothetical protein